MHSAPPGAAYQGYGPEYYLHHPAGYAAPHVHPPAGLTAAAVEDDRCATDVLSEAALILHISSCTQNMLIK